MNMQELFETEQKKYREIATRKTEEILTRIKPYISEDLVLHGYMTGFNAGYQACLRYFRDKEKAAAAE